MKRDAGVNRLYIGQLTIVCKTQRVNKQINQRNGSQRVNTNGSQKQSLTKMVKNILDSQMEEKWLDTSYSSTVSSTATLVDLTSISQGNSATTRVGASLQVKSFAFNSIWYLADTTNYVRIMVFEWIPSTTADVPSGSELLSDSSSPISHVLPYKPSRFNILYDKNFTLDTYHPIVEHKFKLKLDQKVQFDLGVDTGSRHLYLYMQTDSSLSSHPAVVYQSQLKFVDA
jgi:hypothetical protein